MGETLLQLKNIKKWFSAGDSLLTGILSKRRYLRAVDGVSFNVDRQETFGLVGESGCGKSTIAELIVGLSKPTEGRILFDGKDLSEIGGKERKEAQQRIQIILQKPMASLDPRWSIGRSIAEPLVTHGVTPSALLGQKVADLLESVGLEPKHRHRYPHQFSGGQIQRIALARALAVEPDLLIADEPVSSLDVSVQAQILNLMQDLQDEFGLSILFISHDLSVVKYLSDRVGVMYLGKLMELGPAEEVLTDPAHPYTKALISAIPTPSLKDRREAIILEGSVPSPLNPPSKCRFRTRCPAVMDICSEVKAPMIQIDDDHFAACHLLVEDDTKLGGRWAKERY